MKYIYVIGFLVLAMLVSASAASADVVTRTLPASVSPGDTITVSLAINYANPADTTQLAIIETIPSGWTVVSTSDGGDFTSQPGKITWLKARVFGTLPADGTSFTYTVMAPSTESGIAIFSGVYGTNIAETDITIPGDSELTISGVGGTDTVARTLPASVSPGDTITVSLAINYANPADTTQLAIVETIPFGWTVVSASEEGDFDSQPGKITWLKARVFGTLPADGTSFTYTVMAPSTASGTAIFSGVYGTNIAGTDITIPGDNTLTIIPNSPDGTITVTTNNPGATFTITGPANYSGSGTTWNQSNAPVGTYSITFGSINGFNTPSDTPKTLLNGGTITFSGTYTPKPDNGWSMDILANSTDIYGNLLNLKVNYGVNSIATDGYDGAPFDINAAPVSPTGFDLRFSEPGVSTEELINDTKAPGISKNWTLLAQAPKSRIIYITWSSENIPADLMMQIQELDLNTGSLIGSPIDMKSVNSINFTSGAFSNLQKGFKITASSQISHSITLSRGWNMISLPVNVSEASIGAIFGSNVSTVYGWTGTSYEMSNTLESKRGYWALSSSNYDVTVTGTPVVDRDITLTRGWNMVGPVTNGVMVSSLPNVTTVYGWTGTSYTILDSTDTLTLTKGYWMLANAASTIQV